LPVYHKIIPMEPESQTWLYTPPTSSGDLLPPAKTRAQTLPFGQITWQSFEKLCYRLVRLEADVEQCRQYGVQGSEQEGIDIFARVAGSAKYRTYQCKNVEDFGPAKIKQAVEEYIRGEWVAKSDTFILCTRESLRQTGRTNALEEQAEILKEKGVSLLTWDEDELCSKLKSHPDLVDDFFDRPWVEAFCGKEAAASLGKRLDAKKLAELRRKLCTLYGRIFNFHDRGIPLADALPLYERYILPDIEDLQSIESPTLDSAMSGKQSADLEATTEKKQEGRPKSSRRYIQRFPISYWATRSKRSLLFGEPGAGKSTFLRFLALDLLQERPSMEKVAERWGTFVPVWIPFALWTKTINEGPIDSKSVAGIVSAFLRSWDGSDLVPLVEQALEDKRLLLLLDGLDEHPNVEAARIALNHLGVFMDESEASVIATTRPHGFEELGMRLDGWQQAKIADFSKPQQKELAELWFEISSQKVNPTLEALAREQDIEKQTENFFNELSRSNELKELARNPLLLCLLISFQISNVRLPQGRFTAYQTLTDHLLSIHPQRRREAADATNPASRDLSEENLKKALAYLANQIHSDHNEGVISESGASDVLIRFLTDDEQGFGMNRHRASETAQAILNRAEDNLGILVKRSQNDVGFYHRTMQEYLVSFNISRLPIEEQVAIVKRHCADPSWHEVILGLFQITPRPEDVKKMVEAIQSESLDKIEEKNVESLLAETAFGNFNCPPLLAKSLAKKAIDAVEMGTWVPHRERILRHVLEGLRSPVLSEVVQQKVGTWFPDRVRWGMPYMFKSMSMWPADELLVQTLFKGLNAEAYEVKAAAGGTLAKLFAGNAEIGKRLVDIVNYSDDPLNVAVAIETLLIGWKDNPSLSAIVNRAAGSKHPQVKLAGIRGCIEFRKQTEKNLDDLLWLADRNAAAHLSVAGSISDLIIKGWPKNERVKNLCLRSPRHWVGDRRREIDTEIAYAILLNGYEADDHVIAFCINQLEHEKYPFLLFGHRQDAFRVLARKFKDNPAIVAAADTWLKNHASDMMSMETSQAALVGRTPAFKQKLLADLKKESFPHWPARSLLEGWGMQDKEVARAFDDILKGGDAKKISSIAHLLPKIIPDKAECRKVLLDTLRDPKCERQDFVLNGLVELGVSGNDTDVVDVAIPLIESDSIHGLNIDGFKAELIENYSFDPRIKELAFRTLEGRDEPYWAVACAFGDDVRIRERIAEIATPLPASLRQIIAEYLSDAEIDDAFALKTLALYDHEKDDEVKVQASIGYHTRLKHSGKDISAALKTLSEGIVCAGPDHEERRMAAFCGLVILNKLEIMNTVKDRWDAVGKAHISSISGVNTNVPHIQFLLRHWDVLKDFFKEGFWGRLFRDGSGPYVWNHLARFADEYDSPREELAAILESHQTRAAQSETLSFLGRVKPGGTLLLEYCLDTIGLSESKPGDVPARNRDQNLTYRDTIAAAEILGDQFAENKEMPKRLYTEKNRYRMDELVLALSEGWPDSEELDMCFKELQESKRSCWESTIIRFNALRAGVVRLYLQMTQLIRAWSLPRYRLHEAVLRPMVRRLQKDDRLILVLMRRLVSSATSSEKASIARLIYRARGLTPQLKEWAKIEIEKQLSGAGTEMGYDITTNEIVSIPHVIYGLLVKTS